MPKVEVGLCIDDAVKYILVPHLVNHLARGHARGRR
jgi:hypothetical protein